MKNAFKTFKDRFMTAPILAYFDPDKKTIIETNASDFANGAVLYQPGATPQVMCPVANEG